MKNILLIMVLAAFPAFIALGTPPPLQLDWGKQHRVFEPPPGYRYYMGDLDWGKLVFVGTHDLIGIETELQLSFDKGRIISAVLILGGLGIDEYNCLKKYKKMVGLLNKKYGHYIYKFVEKDPVLDELIYAAHCYPVKIGLYRVQNFWKTPNFIIKSILLGEEDSFFIEIEYISRKYKPVPQSTKVIERL